MKLASVRDVLSEYEQSFHVNRLWGGLDHPDVMALRRAIASYDASDSDVDLDLQIIARVAEIFLGSSLACLSRLELEFDTGELDKLRFLKQQHALVGAHIQMLATMPDLAFKASAHYLGHLLQAGVMLSEGLLSLFTLSRDRLSLANCVFILHRYQLVDYARMQDPSFLEHLDGLRRVLNELEHLEQVDADLWQRLPPPKYWHAYAAMLKLEQVLVPGDFSYVFECARGLKIFSNDLIDALKHRALESKARSSAQLKACLVCLHRHGCIDSNNLILLLGAKESYLVSLVPLLKILHEQKCIQQGSVKQLLAIDESYHSLISEHLCDLRDAGALNDSSLKQVLSKLGTKLARAEESCATRLEGEEAWLLNGKLRFFTEGDKPEHVNKRIGSNPVKHCYGSMERNKPLFVCKSVKKPAESYRQLNTARRDVKYTRLMGRRAHFYKDDKVYRVLTEWLPGVSLDRMKPKSCRNIPMQRRVKALIPALTELDYLHQHLRVHGDVKDSNCIYDVPADVIRLIDFGSSRKLKPKLFQIYWTHCYLDPDIKRDPTKEYRTYHDMYSFAFVVARLFPEFFTINLSRDKYRISSLSVPKQNVYGQAMQALVLALLLEPRMRSTSYEVLDFVKTVADLKQHHLDDLSIRQLVQDKLQNTAGDVENVIRGHVLIG